MSDASIYADLHIHTTLSDGQLELDEVPSVARDAGLGAVAITDHDAIHPGLDEPFERREGVDIIRGIELRVEPDALNERIDLLGYGVRETPELREEIDRLQADRRERARRIVRMVEVELDIELDVDVSDGVGRPHIARAIDENEGTDLTYEGAFQTVIGRDGPCYTSRNVTSFEYGKELLSEACGLVSLAHPYRYDDPVTAIDLAADLDGVECLYPYHDDANVPADPHLDENVARRHGLVMTGGSDAHDKTLGKAGLMESFYEKVLDAAGIGR